MRSRSSAEPNSTTILPRRLPIWIWTRVASCSESSSSTSARGFPEGSGTAAGAGGRSGCEGWSKVGADGGFLDLPNGQVLRRGPQRQRPLGLGVPEREQRSARGRPGSAPRPGAPARRAAAGAGGSCSRCGSATSPRRSASVSCFRPSSSRSRGTRPRARSGSGLRGGCSRSRPREGTPRRRPRGSPRARWPAPASLAARSRRSPAISSNPELALRTTIGCRIPTSRIDRRERVQRLVLERGPRLPRVRRDRLDGDLESP